LYRAYAPPSGPASDDVLPQTITLTPNEQRAKFLYPDIFLSARSFTPFSGMLLGSSDLPVAIVALLQTQTPTGVQYATMAPAYFDALRRNTFMYLPINYGLDADLPIVDYWGPDSPETGTWDLLFERQSSTARRLTPKSGAQFYVIGAKKNDYFDNNVTIDYLQSKIYTDAPIDLSDNSPNLKLDPNGVGNFAFAIKTGLGRYVKVHMRDVINHQNDTDKDLVLEVFVFK